MALDFLTTHEFAHIANGHVDYAEEYLGIREIDEFGWAARAPGRRERALIKQTMEMDADSIAVRRVPRPQGLDTHPTESTRSPTRARTLPGTPQNAMRR